MSIVMMKVFESAMSAPFDLTEMLGKIDTHHIIGNLTDEEREELIAHARSKADPSGGLDVMAILADHDARLRKLEEKNAAPEGGTADGVEEYTPGKWYRNGDVVKCDGKVYICNVPDGAVCVWSPHEYPAYWNEAPDA